METDHKNNNNQKNSIFQPPLRLTHFVIVSSLVALLLSGCAVRGIEPASELTSTYGVVNNKLPGAKHGSYVQWNTQYAVSVRHVGKLGKQTEYMSPTLDLQFIKTPSQQVPKWTNFTTHESVVLKGFPDTDEEVSIQGQVMRKRIWHYDQEVYQIVSGEIIPGMSGGPVVNKEGEVVGINVGILEEKINIENKYQKYSFFLPYSEIEKEWEKFQALPSKNPRTF